MATPRPVSLAVYLIVALLLVGVTWAAATYHSTPAGQITFQVYGIQIVKHLDGPWDVKGVDLPIIND